MQAYCKLRLVGDRSWVRLRVTSETDRLLSGYEVRRDGEEVNPGGEYDRRLRVVDKGLIAERRELRMNLTYAELEEVES